MKIHLAAGERSACGRADVRMTDARALTDLDAWALLNHKSTDVCRRCLAAAIWAEGEATRQPPLLRVVQGS